MHPIVSLAFLIRFLRFLLGESSLEDKNISETTVSFGFSYRSCDSFRWRESLEDRNTSGSTVSLRLDLRAIHQIRFARMSFANKKLEIVAKFFKQLELYFISFKKKKNFFSLLYF